MRTSLTHIRTLCLSGVFLAGMLVIGSVALALKVGVRAPDFTLPSTTGEKISLNQFRGKKPVVLFFYLFAFGGA